MPSKDIDEERATCLMSDNIQIMINDKADETIEKLFKSLLSGCQIGLGMPMKDINLSLILLIYYSANATK